MYIQTKVFFVILSAKFSLQLKDCKDLYTFDGQSSHGLHFRQLASNFKTTHHYNE